VSAVRLSAARTGVWPIRASTDMPGRRRAGDGLAGLDGDAHADALRHLHEVAGGVVGLEHRELRAGAGRQLFDVAPDLRAAEGVDGEAGALAGRHVRGLASLKLAITQRSAGIRLTSCTPLVTYWPEAHADLADLAGLRGADDGVVEVDLGQPQLGAGGLDIGLQAAACRRRRS
jgi:hypothetical protein